MSVENTSKTADAKQTQSPLRICTICPDLTPAASLSPVELEYFAIPSVLSPLPALQGPLSIPCVQPGMNLQPGTAPGVCDRLPWRGVILTARGSNRVIYYTVQLLSSPPLLNSPPTSAASVLQLLLAAAALASASFFEDKCGVETG